MDELTLLSKVKQALNITGNYQDEALRNYISEVKEYMLDAGVSNVVVNSSTSVGAITRGVSDLWNYGSGGIDLSPYFKERVIQLRYKGDDDV